MPRYRYKCSECETEAIVYHLYHETLDECLECRTPGAMVRQLTTPQYRKKTESVTRAGDITKEFIELNREVLNKEKNKREDYDEST
mgnify:CR=1 FL=1